MAFGLPWPYTDPVSPLPGLQVLAHGVAHAQPGGKANNEANPDQADSLLRAARDCGADPAEEQREEQQEQQQEQREELMQEQGQELEQEPELEQEQQVAQRLCSWCSPSLVGQLAMPGAAAWIKENGEPAGARAAAGRGAAADGARVSPPRESCAVSLLEGSRSCSGGPT